MEKKFANEFEEKLKLALPVIEKVVYDTIGVYAFYRIVKNEYPHRKDEVFFTLMEEGDATDKAMRNNKALRQLFKSVKSDITCTYWKEENSGHFRVGVEYEHNFGRGRNGHDLFTFSMNFDTQEVDVQV